MRLAVRVAYALSALCFTCNGCAEPPKGEAEDVQIATAERTESTVLLVVRKGANEVLRATFTAQFSGVSLAYKDAAGATLDLQIDGPPTAPFGGKASAPGAPAATLTTMLAGAGQGTAVLNGESFNLDTPESRGKLADAIEASALGPPLQSVLPEHARVRAKLAETLPVFQLAALGSREASAEGAAWPQQRNPQDYKPPGLRCGDTPGLGMTCSSKVRCPDDAPTCVTPSHDQETGYCTRACLSDDECATQGGGHGSCTLTVTDIPGVSAPVTMCLLGCGEGGSCPALLTCNAPGGGALTECAARPDLPACP